MNGLLEPQDAALMTLGLGLLKGSGPSRVPNPLGSILGGAGEDALKSYQSAAQLQMQAKTAEQLAKLRDAQTQEAVAQAKQRELASEESRRSILAGNQFRSLLAGGDPTDPVHILSSGIQSGAFGPKETADFMGKVMEKQANREQRMQELNLRLADQRLAREDREALQRQMAEMQNQNRQDQIRLASALKGDQGVKPPIGYRWADAEHTKLEPIPGGPATLMTPEQSGKRAMTQQAILDVDRAEKVMFDKDGELRMDVVVKSKAPFGGIGEEARLANTYIRNAVSAKYRLETGAAGNQAEVEDIMSRFMPSPLDNTKTAKDKFSRLKEFMNMSLSDMKGAGLVSDKTFAMKLGNEPAIPTSPQTNKRIKFDAQGNIVP